MKNTKRIIATVLTAVMMISMLPSSVFAAELDAYDVVEPAVEAVSVPAEEQEIESTVEDISVEDAEEVQGSSEEIETVDAADPEAADVIEDTEAPVVTEEKTTIEAEGKDYVVTVTYDASALLPDDVKVTAEEIKANAKKYDDYCDQALEAVQQENADVEELSFTRLFDIKLVDADGNPLEPASAVDVQIRLKDVETVEENTQIVHFAGEEETPEVIEPTVDNDTVTFATDGFSIYAVVTTGDYARLTVNFIKSATDTTTMYVKKQDITDGNLNQVLYDPGVPVQDGKKFLGWTDNQNWTNLSIEQLKAGAKTIDDVRSDVKTTLNASITDGQHVDYYPIMVNIFELYYQDEENNTFKTESLLSVTDSATTTVNLAYTLTGGTATQAFIGWKVKGTETVYKNGESITITEDTTLVPEKGEGKWIYFDENDGGSGGGADYTRPVFVPAGESATGYKPADPTRPGYTFAGWYKGAEDNAQKYNFDTNLEEFPAAVTLYAHWTPNTHASYKVIIWKQKVTDDKNAADADKTYDYLESHTVEEVATDTPITAETLSQYLSYGNEQLGVTDLEHGSYGFKTPARFEIENGSGSDKNGVSADNSTIVNVYYDRAVFALRFKGTSGGTPSYEPVDSGSDVYGLVNGEYVKLTATGDKKIVWSRIYGTLPVPDDITQVYYSNKQNSSSYIYSQQVVSVGSLYYEGSKLLDLDIGATAMKASISSNKNATKYSIYAMNSVQNGSFCQLRWTVTGEYTYTYNGDPYTGQLYKQTSEIVYTGLYGQSFKDADPSYTWIMPDSTHHWKHVSYLDAFTGNLYGHSNVGGTPNTIAIDKSDDTSNIITLVIWEQNTDLSGYTKAASAMYSCVSTDGFNITERVQGMTPSGYRWSTSESMPSTWNSAATMSSSTDGVNANGYTNVKRGSNTVLHVKNDRVKNDIVFMYGSQEVGRTKDIAYGVSLADYQNTTPDASKITVPENQYFVGWYDNPEGVGDPYDWSETMPLGNKLIYAITKPVQYHVIVEMDGGVVQNQSTDFPISYGTIIADTNFMQATKTEGGSNYSLVGYYTDEAFTNLWNFSSKVTADSLWYTYTGPDDQKRETYGDVGRDQTVGIFKLFARWRNDDILKQGGLNIRYRNPNASENLYVDSMHYADLSDVIAAQAPEEADWPEGMRFDGWQLTEGKVYQPGDTFVADSDDAVIENGKYWITLTAVYVEKEEKTPTHIYFYKNDGETTEPIKKYDNVDINKGYEVWTAPTRDGYRFLGWAWDIETPVDGEGQPQRDPKTGELIVNTYSTKTEADFLEYRDGVYYLPDTETVVTQVAADEVLPYHGLYAVWQPTFFTIVHSSDPEKVEKIPVPEGKFNMTEKVNKDKDGKSYIYGGYYHYENNEVGDPYPENGTAMTPIAGTTYYLKEVDKTYLVPVVYAVWSKYTKRMQQFYILTDVDSKDYISVGVDVTGGDSLGNVNYEKNVYDSFTVTKKEENGTSNPPTTKTTHDIFKVDKGFLCIAPASEYLADGRENTSITLRAYFVTPDNVKATGTVEKKIDFNNLRYAGWTSDEGVKQTTTRDLPSTCKYVGSASTNSLTSGLRSAHRYQIKVASEDAITITKVDNGTKTTQSVKAGDNTGKITNIGKANYVFAGWYEDASYSKVADFSNVSKDMTVYAKYVKASNVKLSFAKKSVKAGDVTLKATLKITDQPDIEDVAVDCDFADTSYAVDFTGVKTSKSGKSIVNTYSGTVKFSGLANNRAFSAVISYRTPDGTSVSLAAKSCKYNSGKVTVR